MGEGKVVRCCWQRVQVYSSGAVEQRSRAGGLVGVRLLLPQLQLQWCKETSRCTAYRRSDDHPQAAVH
jgi:hypothetical protein